jgi:hypothetical protein
MQQQFETVKVTIKELLSWSAKGELVLQPKFQRRDVWSDKARSYLIDTILRGKPIPKLYMRVTFNQKTKRVSREIVDGQQRLKSVLLFVDDGFKFSKTHSTEYGGHYFSDMDDGIKEDILDYEFALDNLGEMQDEEIHDIFARLNTYSTTLNNQELRHAKYFGEFRASAYSLAYEFMPFWQKNSIFTDKQILRMVEAEFVSELILAMSEGVSAGDKRVIDNAYKQYDDLLPHRGVLEKRFPQTMDIIGGVLGDTLSKSSFRERRLLYPLFCAIYHMQYGLPEMTSDRTQIKPTSYDKVRVSLEQVDDIFEKLKVAREEAEELHEEPSDPLTKVERTFYEAYATHWVHAKNRKLMTDYIYKIIARSLNA